MKKGSLQLSNPTTNVLFSVAGEPISQGETWVINENAQISSLVSISINFMSNNYNFSSFWFNVGDDVPADTVWTDSNNIEHKICVCMGEIYGGYIDGWYDTNGSEATYELTPWKTVTFATAPTGNLLTWLQANAVKQ